MTRFAPPLSRAPSTQPTARRAFGAVWPRLLRAAAHRRRARVRPRPSSRRTPATSTPARLPPRVYARLAPAPGESSASSCSGRPTASRCAGLALPGAAAFETPLGERAGRSRQPSPDQRPARRSSSAPRRTRCEHSLEVHLPFLQTVLGEFALVPLVVGRASAEEVARGARAPVGR